MLAFLAVLAILAGLTVLVWSADRFVEGAAATARHFRMPPLLIGMLVVGFGTSAPEMVVSAFAAIQGSPGIALGNAYGSNIANIGLILGVTALIRPIAVQPQVLRQELPFLALITILAAWLLRDGMLTRFDAVVLLAVFGGLMTWSIRQSMNSNWTEDEVGLESDPMSIRQAAFWLTAGLVLLVGSSRLLVWGAVEITRLLGINDLLIGLTVVAVGTSLPELASSVMAARRGEDDIALGNILGSNLFNTLVVVGLAGRDPSFGSRFGSVLVRYSGHGGHDRLPFPLRIRFSRTRTSQPDQRIDSSGLVCSLYPVPDLDGHQDSRLSATRDEIVKNMM